MGYPHLYIEADSASFAYTSSYTINSVSSSYAITSSFISNQIYLKYGISGKLWQEYINYGNISTSETDIYKYTLGGGGLSRVGEQIEAEYGGIFVSSGTATRQIRMYFGGNVIFDTGALSISLSSAWTLYLSIIEVSPSVIRYMISLTTEGAALSAYTSVNELTGLDLTSSNELKLTGQAGGIGAANNDIVGKISSGFWKSSL